MFEPISYTLTFPAWVQPFLLGMIAGWATFITFIEVIGACCRRDNGPVPPPKR